MRAVVVYESLWGNTAAVARAIAEGIGSDARALSTAEAVGDALAGVDLLVAGAPAHYHLLPSAKSRATAATNPGELGPPDLSHPPMREWLAGLPRGRGKGHSAAFDTSIAGFWGGGATPRIRRGLNRAGYRPMMKSRDFIIETDTGMLREGELEQARAWGVQIAAAVRER